MLHYLPCPTRAPRMQNGLVNYWPFARGPFCWVGEGPWITELYVRAQKVIVLPRMVCTYATISRARYKYKLHTWGTRFNTQFWTVTNQLLSSFIMTNFICTMCKVSNDKKRHHNHKRYCKWRKQKGPRARAREWSTVPVQQHGFQGIINFARVKSARVCVLDSN